MTGLEEWLSTTEPGLSINFPTFLLFQWFTVFSSNNE